MMNNNINSILDTITINTNYFDFDYDVNAQSDYPFRMITNPQIIGKEQSPQILLTDIYGKKIICDKLQPQKPIRETGILSISKNPYALMQDDAPNLKIQLSIPKYLGKSNFYLANETDLEECLEKLYFDLVRMGIDLNLDKCNISRLDMTKNITTEYSFQTYIPMLKKLNMKRNKKNREYNEQTYLMGNDSREFCCYDKIQDMIRNKEDVTGLPRNVFRAEFRALKKAAVCSICNLSTIKELKENFFNLNEIYCNSLKSDIFNYQLADDNNESEIDIMKIMWDCMLENGRGKKNFYERAILKILLLEQKKILNNVDVNSILTLYEEFLIQNGKSSKVIKMMKSRQRGYIKKINEDLLHYMESDIKTVSIQDLYNEIYEKLVA